MPGALLLPQPWRWQPFKAAAPGDTGTLRVPQGHHPRLAASCSPCPPPNCCLRLGPGVLAAPVRPLGKGFLANPTVSIPMGPFKTSVWVNFAAVWAHSALD